MPPRSLWSGSITFGLVNAPVWIYSAVGEHKLHFHFLHEKDVSPKPGAERVYSLLARAMSESGLAAVTKFVMRDRQHLGLLRVRDGVITLEQLYFADEIRPIDEIKPEKAGVKKEELAVASRLIESYT